MNYRFHFLCLNTSNPSGCCFTHHQLEYSEIPILSTVCICILYGSQNRVLFHYATLIYLFPEAIQCVHCAVRTASLSIYNCARCYVHCTVLNISLSTILVNFSSGAPVSHYLKQGSFPCQRMLDLWWKRGQ
jgi:hypothetical protein